MESVPLTVHKNVQYQVCTDTQAVYKTDNKRNERIRFRIWTFVYKAQVKNTKKYLNSTTVFSRKRLLYWSDYRRGLKDSPWYWHQKSRLKYYQLLTIAVFCGSSRLASHKTYEPSRKSLSEWLTGLLRTSCVGRLTVCDDIVMLKYSRKSCQLFHVNSFLVKFIV